MTTKGTALVTGASTGIGAIYADRLAKQGYDLILTARNAAKLRDVASQLSDKYKVSVEVVAADLGDAAGVRVVEDVLRKDASITALVNNAGLAAVTPLLGSDVDEMEAMIDVNVTALTRLTYAAVPGFVARGGGTIINIASVVAVRPETLNGVYGASKAYVLALSQSLHHELKDKNIRVQAVLPGATATEIWAKAGVDPAALGRSMMNADAMVDAAFAGFAQGELVTIPALPEKADWDRYEAARQALGPNLSLPEPAARYR